MYQFNFPTRMILAEGALDEMAAAIQKQGFNRRPSQIIDLEDLMQLYAIRIDGEDHLL